MLDELIEERRRKLARVRAGADPYPATVARTETLAAARAAVLAGQHDARSVAGRVVSWRDQGKIIFADLDDGTGKLQVILDANELGSEMFSHLVETVDVGDFLSVTGNPLTTKRGEPSIAAVAATIAAKSLRPVPTTWYGLSDTELRLRKRYLDLIADPGVRELFRKKSSFWRAMREELVHAGFLEVETSVLEQVPGGADATPFVTHHNALDQDFFLRISLELPLKKLLVGGFEKVFEIGRIFRNEGIDRDHLQDYTQMECYAAYWDHQQMMAFVAGLYCHVAEATWGSTVTTFGDVILEWGGTWREVDYVDAFAAATGVNPLTADREALTAVAAKLALPVDPTLGTGRLIDLIYKKTVRPTLIEPCFLVGHPLIISPLAKADPDRPGRALRFQVLAAGTEVGNGWAELNDPDEQRKRFEEQMALREAGDEEAQRIDEDFIEALEYGMPPTAGFGLSERLFAVMADKPIRETVFFPPMRNA
ncbi:MAG: lysine--tRNA ligase [bacterium]|nr:lysine--tRNA ligase [bacterium]